MKSQLGNRRLDQIDRRVTQWMARHGVVLLRVSLGVVFLWFGLLKFFPEASPAESLVGKTISTVTSGLVQPAISLPVLAVWESLIGIGLVTGRAMRFTLFLLFAQMPGTVLPVFLFPDLTFKSIPFVLTLEGQYIVKNIVLVCAGIVIGATVRGGRLEAERASG